MEKGFVVLSASANNNPGSQVYIKGSTDVLPFLSVGNFNFFSIPFPVQFPFSVISGWKCIAIIDGIRRNLCTEQALFCLKPAKTGTVRCKDAAVAAVRKVLLYATAVDA